MDCISDAFAVGGISFGAYIEDGPKPIRHKLLPLMTQPMPFDVVSFLITWLVFKINCKLDGWLVQVREEIYEAFENIYPVLTEFRKVQQW